MSENCIENLITADLKTVPNLTVPNLLPLRISVLINVRIFLFLRGWEQKRPKITYNNCIYYLTKNQNYSDLSKSQTFKQKLSKFESLSPLAIFEVSTLFLIQKERIRNDNRLSVEHLKILFESACILEKSFFSYQGFLKSISRYIFTNSNNLTT